MAQTEQRQKSVILRDFSNTSKHRTWSFTYYHCSKADIEYTLKKWQNEKYIFQEEICPKTGKYHLQGTIRFRNARTRRSIQKRDFWGKNAHLEVTYNWEGSIRYCTKENTSTGKKWMHGIVMKEKKKPLSETEIWLKAWHLQYIIDYEEEIKTNYQQI